CDDVVTLIGERILVIGLIYTLLFGRVKQPLRYAIAENRVEAVSGCPVGGSALPNDIIGLHQKGGITGPSDFRPSFQPLREQGEVFLGKHRFAACRWQTGGVSFGISGCNAPFFK